MHPARGGQDLALWADVEVVLGVKGEVCAGERAIAAFALIPNGNVRVDTMIDKPTEQPACAIGSVSSEVLRL